VPIIVKCDVIPDTDGQNNYTYNTISFFKRTRVSIDKKLIVISYLKLASTSSFVFVVENTRTFDGF